MRREVGDIRVVGHGNGRDAEWSPRNRTAQGTGGVIWWMNSVDARGRVIWCSLVGRPRNRIEEDVRGELGRCGRGLGCVG